MSWECQPAGFAPSGEAAGPSPELVRVADEVKALGLDRDRSIELLIERLGSLSPRQAETSAGGAAASRRLDDLPSCPREVGTATAAKVLGVSKDTVLKLREAGVLPYRNASPPGSGRPVFRFPLEAVLRVRNTYQTEGPGQQVLKERPRRPMPGAARYKHLRLEDR